MGYDNPRKLGDRETGGGLALPVWIEFMRHALKGVPVKELERPEGVSREGDHWVFDEFSAGRGGGRWGWKTRSRTRPAKTSAAGSWICSAGERSGWLSDEG
jgi:penicillin-binding protein 1A